MFLKSCWVKHLSKKCMKVPASFSYKCLFPFFAGTILQDKSAQLENFGFGGRETYKVA